MDMHFSQEIPVVTNNEIKNFKSVIIKNAKTFDHPNRIIEKFKVIKI